MSHHVEHDDRYNTIGVFQGQANSAAGLGQGKRPDATPEQLAAVEEWMLASVRQHCTTHGCALPAAARGDAP